ncbi:ATP-dependent zinc metalloprotease FtsH [Persicirhabdus sediminis]|nr:ATP-dependent zinc metalloprotease FtsH [Persicirhabdus sediminis]
MNWRVLILLLVGGTILFAAMTMSSEKAKVFDYSEFRTMVDQGKIVVETDLPDPTEGVEPNTKHRLIAVGDAGITAKLKGYYYSDPKNDGFKYENKGEFPFVVTIDKQLNVKEVNQILRGLNVPNVSADAVPSLEGRDSLTLKDLRERIARGDVLANAKEEPLSIVSINGSDSAYILGRYNKVERIANPDEKDIKLAPFEVDLNYASFPEDEKDFISSIAKTQIETGNLKMLMFNLLPILLIILVLFFLFRQQMKSAGKGAMSFGKSKAKLLNHETNKVTFKNVAGIEEAKEELWEIVDYLRDPKKFQTLGGKLPKGVLMVGPPGTGKTLLARAVAGEADVPFYSISGSDFVEMFVGVGASRVRDMFEQGKKSAPCLIFIDEIDAVGRHRGHGVGGGHDEREQTLNQLLVEMDGFDATSGVIIIAATNRPDVLDPALLRPGRFDREVRVGLPDVKGREEILNVHVRNIKLAADTNLEIIARGTPGFSGAELANLINEAALLAARGSLKEVTIKELEEARDKVRWGRERRSMALSEKEKENTAYHEAGHAILNVLLEHTDPLHKVTIIPRGPALGMAMFLPTEDRFNYRVNELLDQLVVAMGGRVAEEIIFGNVTNGAMGDIRQATNIARQMVTQWGMSEKLGMIQYGSDQGEVVYARDAGGSRGYSEETANTIDSEIKRLVDEAYVKATEMLVANRDTLELVTQALIEYETLDGQQIVDLMEKGSMSNPPSSPTPPPTPDGNQTSAPEPPRKSGEDEDDGPVAGDVVSAPA